jgi:hypothetical protein
MGKRAAHDLALFGDFPVQYAYLQHCEHRLADVRTILPLTLNTARHYIFPTAKFPTDAYLAHRILDRKVPEFVLSGTKDFQFLGSSA